MRSLELAVLLGGMLTADGRAQVGIGATPTTGNASQASTQTNPSLAGDKSSDGGRPIYISGKVVMQDGSQVPQGVAIQRICSGVVKPVAYTDAKGRFSFRWNDAKLVLTDASDAGSASGNSSGGGFGSAQSAGGASPLAVDPFGSRMMNCDLRAYLAGFTSDGVTLRDGNALQNPDIGIIVLRRVAGVEGSSISVTSMLAPDKARRAYEHGMQNLLKNKPGDAAKDFEKAVALYPGYADAWANLGKLLLQQQAIEPARAALRKATEADPKLVAPWVELGIMAAKDANWRESAEFLDRAMKLDPVDFPQAWYTIAVAHYNLKNYEAAEKSAREAVKLDPRHVNPRSWYLLALVLAEKRDYSGAAAELTAYMKMAPNAPDLIQVKEELGRIEKLAGAPGQATTPISPR
jgi:tetratricopeptide (TPR) repeat protein